MRSFKRSEITLLLTTAMQIKRPGRFSVTGMVVILTIASAPAALAQRITATLTGRVTDTTKAAIPKADVQVINDDT
jgi:hypothetical protein